MQFIDISIEGCKYGMQRYSLRYNKHIEGMQFIDISKEGCKYGMIMLNRSLGTFRLSLINQHWFRPKAIPSQKSEAVVGRAGY